MSKPFKPVNCKDFTLTVTSKAKCNYLHSVHWYILCLNANTAITVFGHRGTLLNHLIVVEAVKECLLNQRVFIVFLNCNWQAYTFN